MTKPDPSPARTPLARRGEFWLVVVAAVLAVGVALAVGMAVGTLRGTDAATSAAPRPTPGASSSATPVAPPAEEPPPAAVAIPADCAGIYTRDWAAELAPLVLNPAWTEDPASGPFWGSNDPGAITVLEATTRLTCAWVQPEGGGDLGLITNIAALTPEQETSMIEYLGGLGHDCYPELEGTRCIVEWNVEEGDSGESHFLREGIWSATRWANTSPSGYTHDIVAAIFG